MVRRIKLLVNHNGDFSGFFYKWGVQSGPLQVLASYVATYMYVVLPGGVGYTYLYY